MVGTIGGIGMGMIVSTVPVLVIEAVDPSEQALGSGALSMVGGVLGAVVSPIAFSVMSHDAKVVRGIEFYRDGAFTNVYLMFAGLGLVAALAALLIPKPRKLDEVETGDAVS